MRIRSMIDAGLFESSEWLQYGCASVEPACRGKRTKQYHWNHVLEYAENRQNGCQKKFVAHDGGKHPEDFESSKENE